MRLSYSESVCQSYEKQILISGNGGTVSQDTKNNGCAVGVPRLVPLAYKGGVYREGVVTVSYTHLTLPTIYSV